MNIPAEQLEAMPIESLKAMAYDQLVTIEGCQKTIVALNQYIVKKSQDFRAIAPQKED